MPKQYHPRGKRRAERKKKAVKLHSSSFSHPTKKIRKRERGGKGRRAAVPQPVGSSRQRQKEPRFSACHARWFSTEKGGEKEKRGGEERGASLF